MKKFLFVLILLSVALYGTAQEKRLKAYLSNASFYSPGNGPYLETYLSILGKSVTFIKNENGSFQGTLNVTMLFKQGNEIKTFRKYNLKTVETEDTAHINFVVFDQQRIAIDAGEYDFELEIADINSKLPPYKATGKIAVDFNPKAVTISDIELVESFEPATENSAIAKSGYNFYPYQDFYYPQNISKITYYCEIYNTTEIFGANQPLLVVSTIEDFQTGKSIPEYYRLKRENSSEVNVVFSEFDISKLPSGNYYLSVSVKDRDNKVVTTKRSFFQRSNPGITFKNENLATIRTEDSFVARITNPDTIREYILMCNPISSVQENLFIVNNLPKANLLTMQQFFLNFWLQRNEIDPESDWKKYYYTALGLDEEFGTTNKRGYETDRGRVYLHYGPPNQRVIEPSSAAKPYEIWQYYQFENQTDLKFVFYTPDRSVNDYQLCHSTAIGEIKNVNWQYVISGTVAPGDTDSRLFNNKVYDIDVFGEHSGEQFTSPR